MFSEARQPPAWGAQGASAPGRGAGRGERVSFKAASLMQGQGRLPDFVCSPSLREPHGSGAGPRSSLSSGRVAVGLQRQVPTTLLLP